MKTNIKIEKEVELKFLHVEAGVRHWENAKVDGVEDTEGNLIPCRMGDNWVPLIDIDTGQITNWRKGVKASVHYKVCDNGIYRVLDEGRIPVLAIEGYVPDTLSPKEPGYGDYIIMDIDEDGMINNWHFDIEDFQEN